MSATESVVVTLLFPKNTENERIREIADNLRYRLELNLARSSREIRIDTLKDDGLFFRYRIEGTEETYVLSFAKGLVKYELARLGV